MQDQQINLFDAEFAGAFVERVQRGVVAVVVDPDLGLDEYVVAGEARTTNALANLALVGIRGGRIDEAIAAIQGFRDRSGRDIGRRLKHAEAERRHRNAVVDRDLRQITELATLHVQPPMRDQGFTITLIDSRWSIAR